MTRYVKRFNNRVGASATLILGTQACVLWRMRLRQGVRWQFMFRNKKEFPIAEPRYPRW